MTYRRTVEQRDLRLKRVRRTAQAISLVAGLGGSVGVAYFAQGPAGASAPTSGVTTHVTTPKVTLPKIVTPKVTVPTVTVPKAPVPRVTAPVVTAPVVTAPVVRPATTTPVAVPKATPTVCTTSPSGTVTCH